MTIHEYPGEVVTEAKEVLISRQRPSVSLLQRQFRLGYEQARSLMKALERQSVVTPLQDGIRRLMPSYEAPDSREKARFVRAVFETVRFFWEMWEEDSQGHTGAIRLLKPVEAVGNVVIRNLVLVEYYRRRQATLLEAGFELLEWLKSEGHMPDLDDADTDDLAILCASATRSFSEIRGEEAILQRCFTRLSRFLYREYLEGGSTHSRCFEYFVAPSQTPTGYGKNGGNYPEHVMPLAFLRDRSFVRFAQGASVEDVAKEIRPFVVIVKITVAEKDLLDNGPALGGLGWRDTMPQGWTFETGDLYARLRQAGIAFEPPRETSSLSLPTPH